MKKTNYLLAAGMLIYSFTTIVDRAIFELPHFLVLLLYIVSILCYVAFLIFYRKNRSSR